MRGMVRSRAAAAISAFGLVLGLTLMGAASTSAAPREDGVEGADSVADEASATAETPDIVVEPDSGNAPEDPGDRGGAYQGALFLAILAGVGGVALFAVRDVRRHRPGVTAR